MKDPGAQVHSLLSFSGACPAQEISLSTIEEQWPILDWRVIQLIGEQSE